MSATRTTGGVRCEWEWEWEWERECEERKERSGAESNRESQAGTELMLARIINAPSPDQLSLMLRAFLVRLAALDGQLTDLDGEETTFAVVVENSDGAEPSAPADGVGIASHQSRVVADALQESPWVPALQSDTLNATVVDGHHEPLLAVRAVETGVIDVSAVWLCRTCLLR